jgi:hypothetical protein
MKYLNFIPFILALTLCLAFSACGTTGNRERPEEFIVEMDSMQVEIGQIELQLDTLLGIAGLRRANVTVLYFPREDAVCLRYSQNFITYNQFWSRTGREAFINALSRYNEDYDARELNRNTRQSRRAYGTVQGYLVWQQFSFSIRARANMDVELGYEFRDRAPYFTVNQREAEYIDRISRDNNRTSQIITMFFTRAQAAELAALFEQQFLDGLDVLRTNPSTNTIRDEY